MERWLPDAFVFVIGLTFLTMALALWRTEARAPEVLTYWYGGLTHAGFLTFAMQILLVVVTGYVVGTSPPVHRFIEKTSGIARTPRAAYGFLSLLTGAVMLLNWSLGLVVGGLYVRAVARRVPGVDYRVLCAASFTGMLLWHGGFSGSIPLSLNTPGHPFVDLCGIIPTGATLFSPLNVWTNVLLLATLPLLMMWVAPTGQAVEMQVDPLELEDEAPATPPLPATWMGRLVHRRSLGLALGVVGLIAVAAQALPPQDTGATSTGAYTAFLATHPHLVVAALGRGLNLNLVFVVLLFLGLLLHRSPAAFATAMTRSIQSAAAIVYQFPLYSGIAAVMSKSGLGAQIAHAIVAHATATTFPALAFLSAGLVNLFVPSGGGQWVVQGELILTAARDLHVPAAKAALAVGYGDAWTNMIQPFWSLLFVPIIGRGLNLRSQDFLGYALLAFVWAGVVWILCLTFLPV